MRQTAITTAREALIHYADQVRRSAGLAASTNAQPEDQLKPVVAELVRKIGNALNLKIEATTESRIDDIGRPDLAILKNGLLVGYIELKAPDVNIARMTGRDALQFKRFRMIPNLIYTNGSDWMFYRRGENDEESRLQRPYTIRMDGLVEDGAEAIGDTHPQDFVDLFYEFLDWAPIVPGTAKGLAEQLAPLTRLLRDEVSAAVSNPDGKALKGVYEDWQRTLFPEASVEEFADSYAQTVTYGLLLARISGSHVLNTREAARAIAERSGLLARTLEVLTQPGTRAELGVAIQLLERTIDAVDAGTLASKSGTDPWLYFYEDFLAVYDPELRNRRGVYYTPAQVVQAQVRLVDDVLRTHLGRPDGIAADDVTILDPALGTGTYLLTALQYGAEKGAERWGQGAKGNIASKMAKNLFGFELLVGPYAVAHVRLTQLLQELGGTEPEEGMNVYLTDTLESPNDFEDVPNSYWEEPLTEERRRAREVKSSQRILVCIGNPPYERETITNSRSAGGWVRYGNKNQIEDDFAPDAPILEDFLAPAREAGKGGHLKNLYNLYVYFWRWAMWKVKQSSPDEGIVAFITASSFLGGPGFLGMRSYMQETFSDIWILDLGGDSRGTRTSDNVFDIQTPVCITVGVVKQDSDENARVHYGSVEGVAKEKLEQLASLTDLSQVSWQTWIPSPGDPFYPNPSGVYSTWPRLTSVLPWQQSGVKAGRNWVISESEDVLVERLNTLAAAPKNARKKLFKDSPSGRKSFDAVTTRLGTEPNLEQIESISSISDVTAPIPYAYRTMDMQWVIPDYRVLDRPGPPLWKSMSDRQVYVSSQLTKPLGLGSAVTAFPAVPDLDSFCNRGGKDIIPLYRDSEATQPNITSGLLSLLEGELGISISPEDLMAYVAGIMGSPAYTSTFEEELATPGPRIPITRDGELFQRVAEVGKQVIAWQTYARRFPEAIGTSHAHVPQGSASVLTAIPQEPDKYPESLRDVSYDDNARQLKVRDGVIEDVAPEVFNYEVSGFRVVRSWLGYRVKNRSGRKSSPLDDIRPEHWTWEMTQGLLELLWAVEGVVNLEPAQAELLEEVLAGEVFLEDELPSPTDAERKPPSDKAVPTQTRLM